MQQSIFFKYLRNFFRFALVACFIISVYQDLVPKDGTISLFGYELKQFYPKIEFRILPLLWVSYFMVSQSAKILGLKSKFYLSEFLLTILVFTDAFTHITNIYSSNFKFFFYPDRVWFDKVMHFFEGAILLMAIYPLIMRFAKEKIQTKKPSDWAYWITMGFCSIFFIAWEVFELIADKIIGKELLVRSHYDTNEDLMFAFIGFIVGFTILEGYKYFKIFIHPKFKTAN